MSTRLTVLAVGFLAAFGMMVAPAIGCDYVVGDVNGSGHLNGMDVVYAINYYGGGPLPPPYTCECPVGSGNVWFVAGDANGSCSFTGSDVTFLVRFFKGGLAPIPCPNCAPTSLLKQGRDTEPELAR